MDEQGYTSVAQMVGKAVPSVTGWSNLNLNHVEKAVINQDLCIQCGRCHVACEDTSHQAITATRDGKRHFEIKEEECVGCNLCVSICPVPDTHEHAQAAAGRRSTSAPARRSLPSTPTGPRTRTIR
jgi:dihydropyrimidine dehydrogenase (NAD+) subunit PreA